MASYLKNHLHIMFVDQYATVVGDRLVTVKKSKDIEVRLVHMPDRVMHTISIQFGDGNKLTAYITPVPGQPELIVTGHDNGDVHLWDIGKGASACKFMNESRRARA
jgi:hypothetical protein